MFKKLFKLLVITSIILLFSNSSVFAVDKSSAIFDKKDINKGLIGVEYSSNKKMKLMIEKDGQRYFYDLKKGIKQSFPLQLGNGEYKIAVLENKSGKKYRAAESELIDVKIDDEKKVFLNSIQIIEWNDEMQPIKTAKELTSSDDDNVDKVKDLYDYIVKNVKYDDKKINKIKSDYIPNINDTYKDSNGICYDYSALFAAMTRSQGIPTKLVKGYKNDIDAYHAWNEVFIDGSWETIDTTYDAYLASNDKNYSMIKDFSEYKKEKEY